jgi:hypothetical protein
LIFRRRILGVLFINSICVLVYVLHYGFIRRKLVNVIVTVELVSLPSSRQGESSSLPVGLQHTDCVSFYRGEELETVAVSV